MTDVAADFRNLIHAALHRPTVIGSGIHTDAIEKLHCWVSALPSARWCDGDGSNHSWDEYHLTDDELNWFIRELPPVSAIAALSNNVVGWINRFGYGAWIAPHRDAGGDVQCIVPLELTAPDQGGVLWIGSREHSIPMQLGDLLLFNASKLPHGTTQIVARSARRITINLRFWMDVRNS